MYMIEICSVSLQKGIVEIEVLDVSELQLEQMRERSREDEPAELKYRFDLHEVEEYNYLGCWLRKATKRVPTYQKKTWDDVLLCIIGRTYSQGFSSKYRVWE